MALKSIYNLLSQYAGSRLRPFLVYSLGSGLLEGGAIAALGLALTEYSSKHYITIRWLILLIFLLGGYYITFRKAMHLSTQAAFTLVSGFQSRILELLRRSRYQEFQRLPHNQVYAAFLGNTDMVVEAARLFAAFFSGSAMMLCALAYAAIISLPGLILVFAILGGCAFACVSLYRRILSREAQAAEHENTVQSNLEDLIDGFTELKMHPAKADDLLGSCIQPAYRSMAAAKQDTQRELAAGLAFWTAYGFLPVGAVLFFLHKFTSVDAKDCVQLIAVTLFSLTPIAGLVVFAPLASRAFTVIRALERFEQTLASADEKEEATGDPAPPPFHDVITFQNAVFRHQTPGISEFFSLTIDSFTLRRGELLFITGGNGSGKTTFMRILAGLYPLDEGALLLDGVPMEQLGLASYRALFSAVFTDFHLFEALYGLDHLDNETIRGMLARMRLSAKVTVGSDRRFSTVTELSTGQRKRLALGCALLENRPILLFDEVAADFDVRFRAFFYRELLPELKSLGKTIVAISHDDRFFDVADRVVQMRSGAFVQDESPREPCPPESR